MTLESNIKRAMALVGALTRKNIYTETTDKFTDEYKTEYTIKIRIFKK